MLVIAQKNSGIMDSGDGSDQTSAEAVAFSGAAWLKAEKFFKHFIHIIGGNSNAIIGDDYIRSILASFARNIHFTAFWCEFYSVIN